MKTYLILSLDGQDRERLSRTLHDLKYHPPPCHVVDGAVAQFRGCRLRWLPFPQPKCARMTSSRLLAARRFAVASGRLPGSPTLLDSAISPCFQDDPESILTKCLATYLDRPVGLTKCKGRGRATLRATDLRLTTPGVQGAWLGVNG